MGLALCTAMTVVAIAPWLPGPKAERDAFMRDEGNLTWTMVGKPGRVGGVAIGSVGNQLSFVVFSPASSDGTEKPHPVRDSATYGFRPDGTGYLKSHEVTLKLPQSGSLLLPIRAQLIEVRDGKVRFSDRKVTLDEVKAYLHSKDAECSLDDLLCFVDAQRKRGK